MQLETRRGADDSLELALAGEWRTLEYPRIEAALAAVNLSGVRRIELDTEHLSVLDLAGAWRLREFLSAARQAGISVGFRGEPPPQLALIESTLATGPPVAAHEARPGAGFRGALARLGREAATLTGDLVHALAFLGRLAVTLLGALTRPRRLRPVSMSRHIYDTGVTAIPIVVLIGFLISVIVAYMSAQQLRSLGAEIYVVDLVTIGVLRELGVLLTAIIVAGRSGSAFAAELGSMRLNEEIDALQATGVEPFGALVAPRVLGLMIALPLLTVLADVVGLAGGAVLCGALLQMPLEQYIHRASEAISPSTFWIGIVKAPFFAALIALSGCQRGMQVRGSARELGRLTTVAVVQSIFLVILADALFAVLFLELDV